VPVVPKQMPASITAATANSPLTRAFVLDIEQV
jgi:hypothetical protein